jgi:hypothetical protein
MARIKIDDLPPDGRDLTPEELAEIEGAGRPSFRPTLESLESREVYSANLGGVAPPGLQPLGDAARDGTLVRQAPLADEIYVGGLGHTAALSPALDTALGGFGGGGGILNPTSQSQGSGSGLTGPVKGQDVQLPPGVPPAGEWLGVTWGQWQDTANGGHTRTGTSQDGSMKWVETILQDHSFLRTANGVNVVEGREDPFKHTYAVTESNLDGTKMRVQVFNNAGPEQKLAYREVYSLSGTKYTKETWGSDGQYVNEYYDEDAGGLVCRTETTGTLMTITYHHQKGVDVVSGVQWSKSSDAEVKWVYSVGEHGERGELLEYHANDAVKGFDGSDYGLNWMKDPPAEWGRQWQEWAARNMQPPQAPPTPTPGPN